MYESLSMQCFRFSSCDPSLRLAASLRDDDGDESQEARRGGKRAADAAPSLLSLSKYNRHSSLRPEAKRKRML